MLLQPLDKPSHMEHGYSGDTSLAYEQQLDSTMEFQPLYHSRMCLYLFAFRQLPLHLKRSNGQYATSAFHDLFELHLFQQLERCFLIDMQPSKRYIRYKTTNLLSFPNGALCFLLDAHPTNRIHQLVLSRGYRPYPTSRAYAQG